MNCDKPSHVKKLISRNRAGHKGAFLYEDVDWMRDAYLTRKLSLREVAAEAECGMRTVVRWMAIHGIETRPPGIRLNQKSGPDHPSWKGGPPACACGNIRSYSARGCMDCRDLSGENNPKWRGDDVEYAALHDRIKKARGNAPDHPCDHCGSNAEEWAYDHLDPNERRNSIGRDKCPYSLDPAHYIPLCVGCHRRFDLGGKKKKSG